MYRELENQAVLANGHDSLIEMDVFSPTYHDSSYGYVTLSVCMMLTVDKEDSILFFYKIYDNSQYHLEHIFLIFIADS